MSGFSYLFQQQSWQTTIIIGTLLTLLSIGIIPSILIAGYCWRVAAHALRDAEPPAFNDWVRLFVEGCRATVALVLPPVATFALLLPVVLVFRYVFLGYSPSDVSSLVALSTLTVGIVAISALAVYLIPAGFVTAVRKDSVLSACSPSIFAQTLSPSYLFLWTIAMSAAFGLIITSLLLTLIPFLGVFLSAASGFYTLVAVTAVFSFGLRWP